MAPSSAGRHRAEERPTAPVRCTPTVDAAELLERNATAFGSAAAVAADLPRWIRWTRADASRSAMQEVVDATRFRDVLLVGGAWTPSQGIDEKGPWMNLSGPLVRLRAGDPPHRTLALDAWIVRRGYLTERAYDASCQAAKDGDGGPTVKLRARRPDLGDPELDFDLASGELRSVSTRSGPGSAVILVERIAWSLADERGVRWPVLSTDPDAPAVSSIETGAGIRCAGPGGATVTAADACIAATPSSMHVSWPNEGTTRLPMVMSAAVPLVRVKVGDREAWALLDSGAEVCVVNANSPDAPNLTQHGAIDVESSQSSMHAGLTVVDRIALGGATFTSVPAVVLPFPADLQDLLDPVPAVAFGYGLFQSMAVRIDFAHREVVLARDAASLVGAGAQSVPIRAATGNMLADVQVEGHPAVLAVDTGTASALLLRAEWTHAYGLPGARPSLLQSIGGPGATTTQPMFAVSRAQLGVIATPARALEVKPLGQGFGEEGTVGAPLLAACAAVVFDVANRMLWLEPPCNHSLPEDRSDMWFGHSDVFTIEPWVVGGVMPGGSADRAGLRVGDRLLEVAGAPARESAFGHIAELMRQPHGTKVPLVVDRDAEKKHIVMTLIDPTSR